jgi:hypothetical protein
MEPKRNTQKLTYEKMCKVSQLETQSSRVRTLDKSFPHAKEVEDIGLTNQPCKRSKICLVIPKGEVMSWSTWCWVPVLLLCLIPPRSQWVTCLKNCACFFLLFYSYCKKKALCRRIFSIRALFRRENSIWKFKNNGFSGVFGRKSTGTCSVVVKKLSFRI